MTVGDECICLGDQAGTTLNGEDRIIEINVAGVGLRKTVMTAEEAPIVRAVILRMFEQDIAWACGNVVDTRGFPQRRSDER